MNAQLKRFLYTGGQCPLARITYTTGVRPRARAAPYRSCQGDPALMLRSPDEPRAFGRLSMATYGPDDANSHGE
ncbi:MAG: hypothetical protein HY671_06535 [Chloroflexi bacterium]|nr:hypothetical protein [Chloroflexota bacterium]